MQQSQIFLTEQPDALAERKLPHLGHAAIFGALYVLFPALLFAVVFAVGYAAHRIPAQAVHHPRDFTLLTAFASAGGALLTLLACWPFLQWIWERPFWSVLSWNSAALRPRFIQLIVGGLALAVAASSAERFMTLPKEMPIDALMHNKATLWILTLYGSIIAPLVEETFFRGILLLSIARALDWFRSAPLDPLLEWRDGISKSSIYLSAALTSLLFGLVHAAQLGNAWNAAGLLACVGMVLALVRIRTNSLACSTLVHAAYNGSMFLALMIATGGYRHLDAIPSK